MLAIASTMRTFACAQRTIRVNTGPSKKAQATRYLAIKVGIIFGTVNQIEQWAKASLFQHTELNVATTFSKVAKGGYGMSSEYRVFT